MLQSVATWFGNEAKRQVREPTEPTGKSMVKGRKKNPGKQWNKRLVAAHIHADRLNDIYQEMMREYSGEGQANLRTYSSAVSALIKELSEEELADCQETADSWNKEPAPKEIQQKLVACCIPSR